MTDLVEGDAWQAKNEHSGDARKGCGSFKEGFIIDGKSEVSSCNGGLLDIWRMFRDVMEMTSEGRWRLEVRRRENEGIGY